MINHEYLVEQKLDAIADLLRQIIRVLIAQNAQHEANRRDARLKSRHLGDDMAEPIDASQD